MPKRGVADFLRAVFNALDSKPKTVNEVAELAGTSWDSTKNAIELFQSFGIAKAADPYGKTFVKHKDVLPSTRNDNLFQLPLTAERENLINFIFEETRKCWKSKTSRDIGKTQMQKLLIEVIEANKLDVPNGWYLYGRIGVKTFDPSKFYNFSPPRNAGEITSSIKTIVNKYHNYTATQLENLQYESNPLYKAKRIAFVLSSVQFNKKSFSNFNNSIIEMLKFIDSGDSLVIDAITDFVGINNNLLPFIENNKLLRPQILSTLNEVWKLVAQYQLYRDMLKWYSESQLIFIRIEIETQKRMVSELLSFLENSIPQNEPKFPEYEALKSLQGSAKPIRILSEHEKNKLV